MRRARLILAVTVTALIGGAIVHAVIGRMGNAAAATDAHPARATSSTVHAPPPIAVVSALVKSADQSITRSYVAWVEPIASVALHSQIDGVIVDQAVAEGDTVKRGDPLFQLDDRAIAAAVARDQAAVAKDQASADQLRADLSRLQTLLHRQDVTPQQVQQQQASLDAAVSTVAGDTAQLQADQVQLGYAAIAAPISGRVGVINVTVGDVVHVGDATPLLTITQMAPIRVTFDAPERDLALFRTALALPTHPPVRIIDATTGKVRSEGTLAFIDSSVDTASGTVVMKAEVANADGGLWPGEYVRVEPELGVHHDAVVAPLVAIQENTEGSYVFVVGPDGTVALRPVTVADTNNDEAVISGGLQPGEHVVVEGQLHLSDGQRVAESLSTADIGPREQPE
jgi:membrane fusion protein, multidrug efflux system